MLNKAAYIFEIRDKVLILAISHHGDCLREEEGDWMVGLEEKGWGSWWEEEGRGGGGRA